MKPIQTYAAPGITVTFDPNLCVHSAVCLASLPAVFDVRRRRWIRPEAASVDEVVKTVGKCPSGALKHALTGVTESTADPRDEGGQVSIQASMNGPLLVQGAFQLLDENGREIGSPDRAALCRCGGTSKQPFCDGSHRRVGFSSKSGPVA